jgi:hypothetical protein
MKDTADIILFYYTNKNSQQKFLAQLSCQFVENIGQSNQINITIRGSLLTCCNVSHIYTYI